MDSVWGGGGGSRHFPGSIFCGVGEFFPLTPVTDPKFVFFPLTAVTDPTFVLFKHVLCFARIMSTLCPNSCRQTARIGGGSCPLPPVPYAYVSREEEHMVMQVLRTYTPGNSEHTEQ